MKDKLIKFSYLHYDFTYTTIAIICIFFAVNTLMLGALGLAIVAMIMIKSKLQFLLIIVPLFLLYSILQVEIVDVVYTKSIYKIDENIKNLEMKGKLV